MDPEPFDKFTKSTIQILANNLNNFTLQESIMIVVSGVPAHKITYTLADINDLNLGRKKIVNGL